MSSQTNNKKCRSKWIWVEVGTGDKSTHEYFSDLLEKEEYLNKVNWSLNKRKQFIKYIYEKWLKKGIG